MMRDDNDGGEVGGKKMSECRPTYTYHHTNEQNIGTESMGIIRPWGPPSLLPPLAIIRIKRAFLLYWLCPSGGD